MTGVTEVCLYSLLTFAKISVLCESDLAVLKGVILCELAFFATKKIQKIYIGKYLVSVYRLRILECLKHKSLSQK